MKKKERKISDLLPNSRFSFEEMLKIKGGNESSYLDGCGCTHMCKKRHVKLRPHHRLSKLIM